MPSRNPVFRAFAIAGFASLAAVVVLSTQPPRLTFSEGHGSRIVGSQFDQSEQRAKFLRASFIRTEADQIAAARRSGNECARWDVSAAEMEMILQEMIRRGWQPPSRSLALADLPMSGSALFPLDPQQPMPQRYSQTPGTAEDGPIPPTTPDALEEDQPTTTNSPATDPAAPSAAKPATPQPSAADLIASPQPAPH